MREVEELGVDEVVVTFGLTSRKGPGLDFGPIGRAKPMAFDHGRLFESGFNRGVPQGSPLEVDGSKCRVLSGAGCAERQQCPRKFSQLEIVVVFVGVKGLSSSRV